MCKKVETSWVSGLVMQIQSLAVEMREMTGLLGWVAAITGMQNAQCPMILTLANFASGVKHGKAQGKARQREEQ